MSFFVLCREMVTFTVLCREMVTFVLCREMVTFVLCREMVSFHGVQKFDSVTNPVWFWFTSLQLSFTAAAVPVTVGQIGFRAACAPAQLLCLDDISEFV